MSSTIDGAPADSPGRPNVVTLGDRQVTIERMSSVKFNRAFVIVREAGDAIQPIIKRWLAFEAEYRANNTIELDRAAARMRYGPRPIFDDGEPLLDDAGQQVMTADALAHMTDEDWAANGNKLRLPQSPSMAESVAAVLPEALEAAELHVYRLLALLAMPNAEALAAWRTGELKDRVEDAADELVEGSFPEDLVELAVVAGETLDEQFRSRIERIGKSRLGNALRLFGLNPSTLTRARQEEPQTSPQDPQTGEEAAPSSNGSPESSTPTLSTDGPAPTDGPPTTSSDVQSTYSQDSATESKPTPSERPSLKPVP